MLHQVNAFLIILISEAVVLRCSSHYFDIYGQNYLCNDVVNFVFNTFSIILKYFDIFSIIPDTVGTIFNYILSPT